MVRSKKIFAVNCEVYLKSKPSPAILVIANDVVAMIFRGNKNMVVSPFSMEKVV